METAVRKTLWTHKITHCHQGVSGGSGDAPEFYGWTDQSAIGQHHKWYMVQRIDPGIDLAEIFGHTQGGQEPKAPCFLSLVAFNMQYPDRLMAGSVQIITDIHSHEAKLGKTFLEQLGRHAHDGSDALPATGQLSALPDREYIDPRDGSREMPEFTKDFVKYPTLKCPIDLCYIHGAF